jgi:hypothetical protein
MPDVATIPIANELYQQLAVVNDAIAMLGLAGSSITYATISPPPPTDNAPASTPPMSISISPPIDDPAVLKGLSDALQKSADVIKKALAALGYTDAGPPGGPPDIPPGGGPPELPKPPDWPDDLPWPPIMPPVIPMARVFTPPMRPPVTGASLVTPPSAAPPPPPDPMRR